MGSSPWIRLADATDPARAGGKAATLARLLGEGFPVVPGWVLPVGAPARIETLLAEPVSRWILRSSSPLEDRPGFSAAGLFASVSANASPDELARALRSVLESGLHPRVAALLGSEAPVAVLAQPHLDFKTWCTVERRDGALYYEGWTAGGLEPFQATTHPALDALVHAAAACTGTDPALLEVGLADTEPWILQVRTAPSRAPARESVPPGSTVQYAGLGPRVHPGDDAKEWRPDLEHCPTPLSVLLATTFGRWIAADPANSPSRIIDGRWHDRTGVPGETDDPEGALELWRRQLAERITPAVGALQERHDALDGGLATWTGFLEAWLELQRAYFAMDTSGARAWARHRLADAGGRPGLGATPSAERLRRWAMLREQVLRVIDAPTPEAIAHWLVENRGEMLAIVLEQTLRFDRKIAPLPYDGFTPGLDEDPWPLLRALSADIVIPEAGPVADALASSILALAESDNEQLLEAYALWRSAIRRIARLRDLPTAQDLHFVGVEEFEAWLATTGAPVPDAAAGKALHAAWAAKEIGTGTSLQGRAAAGGQARGPVRLARSLLEIEEPGIAVVDTLGPADAVAVPRFTAIVCAGGDLLGHASVLCREFGIPCVVGIAGVRQRLARANEVLVDGDRGLVHDLSEGASST